MISHYSIYAFHECTNHKGVESRPTLVKMNLFCGSWSARDLVSAWDQEDVPATLVVSNWPNKKRLANAMGGFSRDAMIGIATEAVQSMHLLPHESPPCKQKRKMGS